MAEKTFTIKNKLGLHARASALFVKEACQFESEVFVSKGKNKVNGKSIMGILMLAAACGSKIKVETKGPDEAEALKKIGILIDAGFLEK